MKLSVEAALRILRHQPYARLVQTMNTRGVEFFVVPGGHVRPIHAQEIIRRKDVVPADAGLFHEIPQSWRCV